MGTWAGRRMLTLGVCVVASACGLSWPNPATSGLNTLDARISALAERALSDAPHEAASIFRRGSLGSDDVTDVWIPVESVPAFAVVAACDDDCRHLEMELYDDDGDLISSDETVGPDAVVRAVGRRSGMYRLRLYAGDCAVEPCAFALALYVVLAPPAGFEFESLDRLPEFFYERSGEIVERFALEETGVFYGGLLPEDGEAEVSVVIGGDRWYAWIATCDGCGDVDIRLYDQQDRLVKLDTGIDDTPYVTFWVLADERYRLVVHMYRCWSPECEWAAGLFTG